MWEVYLKGIDRNKVPKYVSSLQRTDLTVLPPAYIETAEFDCLRDEGILYAKRLKEAGIEVELNETKGTIHAYDIVRESSVTDKNIHRRVNALNSSFKKKD